MDLVSIDLVWSLGLKPCNKKKHNHEIPALEVARQPLKTYGVYYLHYSITDRNGYQLSFIRPFVTIDRDLTNAPILLGWPALVAYEIIQYYGTSEWEFEQKVKVKEYSPARFQQLLQKGSAPVYEIWLCFQLLPLPLKHKKKRLVQVNQATTRTKSLYQHPIHTTGDQSDSEDHSPVPSDLTNASK
jgi:hypothetical protein